MISKNRLISLWVLFTIIIGISAIFRLILLQFIEFKGDEALNLFLATRPIFHHPFPPASQASSAGILNFPLLNYLLFPIVIFTSYPPTISFVIALLNVITIGGFFLLFAKYHGKIIGFLAASILALSPWAILFSRKIWAQDFILPLSLPFFWSIYKILEGKKNFWLLFGLSSMLLMQIHQLAIIVPFIAFVALLLQKQKPQWKLLLSGICLGLISALPYLWYIASTSQTTSLVSSSLVDRFSFHDFSTFLRPLQIISIGNFYREMGDDFAIFATSFRIPYLVSKLSYLAYILLPIGTVLFFVKEKVYRLFVWIFLVTILAYFAIGVEPLMHYFIILLPILTLLVAFLLANIIQHKKYMLFGILITLLYFISLFIYDYGFFAFLSQKGGFSGEYGSGFTTSENSAKKDLQEFRNNPLYKEMETYYFAPREHMQGFTPVGKMIFPHEELRKDSMRIEKEFLLSPNNPILKTKIFSYYTKDKDPKWEDVLALRKKSIENHVYDFMYVRVLDEYLGYTFKHLYESPDFLLLYPKHWSSQTVENRTFLTDETITVTIEKLLQQRVSSVLLGQHYYLFSVAIDEKDKNNTKIQQYAKENFDTIFKSIVALD